MTAPAQPIDAAGAPCEWPGVLGRRLAQSAHLVTVLVTEFGFLSVSERFTGHLEHFLFLFIEVKCAKGYGEKAAAKPWDGAEGLEWTVPSPAPYHTFATPPEVK